jgi:hypothetical protein
MCTPPLKPYGVSVRTGVFQIAPKNATITPPAWLSMEP